MTSLVAVCSLSCCYVFYEHWWEQSNGQRKWEGEMLEILFFGSVWWGLGVLLSFGPSSVDTDKQQSENQILVGVGPVEEKQRSSIMLLFGWGCEQ